MLIAPSVVITIVTVVVVVIVPVVVGVLLIWFVLVVTEVDKVLNSELVAGIA
jgi:hypothetical protein